jgi:hypothetical protein
MSAPLARGFARRLGGPAAVAVVVLGVAQGVFAGPSSAETVPYTDQSANGVLTFCDSNRQPITSGSIDAAPFVAFAIGSASAPKAYTGDGRTAALYAFQPVKGVDPTVWAGEGMTGYAKYTSPANPMAAGTRLDLKLSDFLRDAPPAWNNLVQIRMYVDAPDEGAYTNVYNAATVQITGKTWKLISPTRNRCRPSGPHQQHQRRRATHRIPLAPVPRRAVARRLSWAPEPEARRRIPR